VAAAGCGPNGSGPEVRAVGAEDGVGSGEAPTTTGDGGGAAAPLGNARPSPTSTTVSPDEPPPVTVAEPVSVAVVGDSLTLAASDEVRVALTSIGTTVLAIDAVESRRMAHGDRPPGVDAIDEILDAGHEPDLWIVALGTNDVGAQVSDEQFTEDVAEVLRHIPPGAQIVWVDVFVRDRADDAVEANRLLRDVLAIRSGVGVVDWYANGDDPGIITDDGIHLTELGRSRFAAQIAAGVVDLLHDD
jgi:lysophospholipase L1-like esterase